MSTRAIRRAERRKERRKQQGRGTARSFPWFSALVVGVVVVLGILGLRAAGAFDALPTGPGVDPSRIKANVGTAVTPMEGTHIDLSASFSSYNTTPPNSGPHWSAQGRGPISWSAYTTTQRNEGVVHNLEHGGILVAYDPALPQDQIDLLRAMRSRWPRDKYGVVKIIVEPYSGMDAKIALTAWGYIDKMDAYDEQRILGFVRAHIDQGPEDAP